MSIIVGIDGSDGSEHALAWAAEEARWRSTDLVLVHGWTAPGAHAATPATLAPLAAAAQAFTDAALASARADAHGLHVEARCVPRRAASALAAAAAEGDLVVVGSHGRGAIGRALVGSVADAVLRLSPVPVAVVRPTASEALGGPVVVGVDGSQASAAALALGVEEAARRGVALVAVHAWDAPYKDLGITSSPPSDDWEAGAAAILDAALAPLPRGTAMPRLVRGDAASALLEAARRAALVIVGSRGLGGVSAMLLGSVSRRLVHDATCPVIVVPGAGDG